LAKEERDMVMGRPNKGIDHVDSCDGSQRSKQRAQVILRTINGELSVNEACEILGIQRPQFARLRRKALQGAVDALEPGRPGRPPTHDAASDHRAQDLEDEVERLEKLLHTEQIRAAIAHLLPGRHGGQKGGATSRSGHR
jgi:hypothetical protein